MRILIRFQKQFPFSTKFSAYFESLLITVNVRLFQQCGYDVRKEGFVSTSGRKLNNRMTAF